MKSKNIITCIIITTCILSISIICLIFNNLYFKTKYIPINKRNSYIIINVDDKFLNNYLQRKNTLVIFFATWCDHCVNEKDTITEFIKSNPNIPVIVVSHDISLVDLEDYLSKNNLNWFTIFDPEKKIRNKIDENSSGIPYLYLVDKDSNVLKKQNGPFELNDILNFYYN